MVYWSPPLLLMLDFNNFYNNVYQLHSEGLEKSVVILMIRFVKGVAFFNGVETSTALVT